MAATWVYYFGECDDKNEVGGKGKGLSEMIRIGLPVPGGFSITTKACIYASQHKSHPVGLDDQVRKMMERLQKDSGKSFGGSSSGQPLLLLSVRSGGVQSMPGMMDTVLNLGLNDTSVHLLAKQTNNERFAWDSYRRFTAMFGDVVMGVPHHKFESAIGELKKQRNIKVDTEMTTADLKQLVEMFKDVIRKDKGGESLPQDPWQQLNMAVDAVFASWDNDRAVAYRTMNGIPHLSGTAVNVQTMVFGNMGDDSGTGVAFTRSPTSGENAFYGEYLTNAQGEDVVAGIRTPNPISEMAKRWPALYKQLSDAFHLLENYYKDMQDCEFTIEQGKLFMLQTRNGKRTAQSAMKIAVDMEKEGIMTREQALLSVNPTQIDQLLHKQLDPAGKGTCKLLAKGLPASPGAGVGRAVFTAARAVEIAKQAKPEPTVLIRLETSPEDIRGMEAAQGVLCARGGMTSHAAVVARGMGRCCVTGCDAVVFTGDAHHATSCAIGGVTVQDGDWITLDGSTGEVFHGQVPVQDPELKGDYQTLMGWADQIRQLEVYTNADTPNDAKRAVSFGAQGIGLVRTEHMFFAKNRINTMREMILADTLEERNQALKVLGEFQREDFEGIFDVMAGRPVVVRLLDPPLHEFLPHEEADIVAVARGLKKKPESVHAKMDSLAECNPMLGFRGCRLAIVMPEILDMQVRAIFLAAMASHKKTGNSPRPEIEVPLVGNVKEYRPLAARVHAIAQELQIKESGVHYTVGAMAETPRMCLTADEIAGEVDFLSFGTNDLTQMTCGFSRDDAGKFLGDYVAKGIYDRDPFVSIDQSGVGKLMQLCVSLARTKNPKVELGICGEHGGEPASVEFAHRIGLSNVSCSPFRVPIARLAAAQAAIKYGKKPSNVSISIPFPSVARMSKL